MNYNYSSIDSLRDYFSEIERISSGHRVVYRGENQMFDKPMSTSYSIHNNDLSEHYFKCVNEWNKIEQWNDSMRQIGENFHIENDWELMVEARHNGLHTRLLDWTYNPLFALWVACDGHARLNSGKSYTNYFSDEQEGTDGFVYLVSLPYKPYRISGHRNNLKINGSDWVINNEMNQNADTDLHRWCSYENPIFSRDASSEYPKSFINAGEIGQTHKYYEVPQIHSEPRDSTTQYSILFFELASKMNERMRAQSGLFSIHSPPEMRLSGKSDIGKYETTEITIPKAIKRDLLIMLEETLNLNAYTFGLATAIEITNQHNNC